MSEKKETSISVEHSGGWNALEYNNRFEAVQPVARAKGFETIHSPDGLPKPKSETKVLKNGQFQKVIDNDLRNRGLK